MRDLKTLTVNGVTYKATNTVPTDSVTLLASDWKGDGEVYSQVVEVPGVTAHTKVDLQPTSEQLAEFHYKILAFVAENEGGIVTVYSIGDKPDGDHTIQITKTEVEGTGKIRGNTVGTTMPRPDWSQTDPTKADYIKNKPDLDGRFDKEKTERQAEIAVERARIDQITAMPEGSTAGDLELQDIRIGYNGVKYPSAGAAVRGQVKELRDNFDLYATNKMLDHEYDLTVKADFLIDRTGQEKQHDGLGALFGIATVTPGDEIKVTGWQWDTAHYDLYAFFDNDGKVVSTYTGEVAGALTVTATVPEKAAIIAVNGKNTTSLSVFGVYTEILSIKTALERTQKLSEDVEHLQTDVADKASVGYVDSATTVTVTDAGYEYPITILDKKLVYDHGEIHDQATGRLGRTNVKPGDRVQVTGYQWFAQYHYSLFHFLNASGDIIYTHTDPREAAVVTVEVTVPEGAVEVLINGHLNTGKIAVVGEHTETVNFSDLYNQVASQRKGVKLITLGDSITALGTGETGWVKYFIEKTGCRLVANVAVNGAWLRDKTGTVYDGNPVFNGADNNVNNVLGNQVQKIINNGYDAPDIIMIAIGTNGGISITKEQIKAAYYDSNNALIPLENVDRTTSAGAYRWCLDKLHETYPDALIVWCTPIMGYQTTRSAENAVAYAESLRIATEYTGQIMIGTIRCGINGVNEKKDANGQYLIDGLHPNVNGAKKIGYYNAAAVKPFLDTMF